MGGIPVESEIEISGIWGEIIGEIGKASTTISVVDIGCVLASDDVYL